MTMLTCVTQSSSWSIQGITDYHHLGALELRSATSLRCSTVTHVPWLMRHASSQRAKVKLYSKRCGAVWRRFVRPNHGDAVTTT
jgi:hypothetical protein